MYCNVLYSRIMMGGQRGVMQQRRGIQSTTRRVPTTTMMTEVLVRRRRFSDDQVSTLIEKDTDTKKSSEKEKEESASSSSSSSSQPPRVITSIDKHGICHVTLNRPEKINACDLPMFEAIAETASNLRDDRSIRAVILSGKGKGFCSGLDVNSIMRNPIKTTGRLLERPSGYGRVGNEIGNLAQDVSYLWREIPVPVIAVLHGVCFGAGLQIALGADMRYVTSDCQLSIMEGKWGLIPDMAGSITLRELIPIDVAKELTMTARIINGTEAAKLGLVTKVFDVDDNKNDGDDDDSLPLRYARQVAMEIVQKSPDAISSAKELFHRTTSTVSEEECLKIETELQRKLLLSWNQMVKSGRALAGTSSDGTGTGAAAIDMVPFLNRKK